MHNTFFFILNIHFSYIFNLFADFNHIIFFIPIKGELFYINNVLAYSYTIHCVTMIQASIRAIRSVPLRYSHGVLSRSQG